MIAVQKAFFMYLAAMLVSSPWVEPGQKKRSLYYRTRAVVVFDRVLNTKVTP
jgi:hypothetical protein